MSLVSFVSCTHLPRPSQSAPVNSNISLRLSQHRGLVQGTNTLKGVLAEDVGNPSGKPQLQFSENVS